MAAAMARPWPVLPEVGSTIVPPGFSRPSRSAASIIRWPMRSLTLPPGFSISSFARMVGLTPVVTRWRRTSGVFPIASRKLSSARIASLPRRRERDVEGRAPAGHALRPDPPVVRLDDGAGDVQAQPRAGDPLPARLRDPHEPFEQLREVLGFDADPLVPDGELDR